MKLSNLPEYYQKQVETKLKNEKINNRNTGASSNRKSSTSVAKKLFMEVHEDKRFVKPVRVSFHSIRRGTPDLDNIQGKAVLDAIVKSGVLQDDGPKWIPERPLHTLECGKEEKTIITIEEI